MNYAFTAGIVEILEKIDAQKEAIDKATSICAEVINSGKLVHLFGSGHSVLPIQDMFPRYGGVVGWHPLMDPRLMWTNVVGPGGARELLWLERQEGYIKNYLQSYNFQEGEAIIIYSHGGLNAAGIETALYAKERGLKVIAVTSGENYRVATATHSSGYKLGDVADVLLDNCCPLNDAIVEVPEYPQKVGASSTIGAIALTQILASQTALELQKLDFEMFIFVSPNVTEVPANYMHEVYAQYTELVKKNGN